MTKEKNQAKKPVWLKYTEEEVKQIILKIIDKEPELTSEKIGLILRDNYGIPTTRLYGIKISAVMKESGKYEPADLKNMEKKVQDLEKHIGKNKQDKRAGRSLILSKARLKKIKEYNNKD